ncbi:MAG: UDP-N-acetylmuramoyl-tripeptide--D-alanyl-D-alanine ligase [Acidobacteriota bacterium]
MAERTLEQAQRAMDARLAAGSAAGTWCGAAFDSRRLAGGELFFALPGARVDGHDFALAAARRGAAGVVIHRDLEGLADARESAACAFLRVDDTFKALHALTRAVRRELPENLVAITGSSGKTTTKELLAAMLGQRFRVARSPGNFNNLYGFPLALLGVPLDTEWMVAEMGMSTPGELAEVSRLGEPDAALFTNVRPVHLENFRSLRDIAEAKSELLAGLKPGGLVIANADDPEVMRIARRHHEARGGRLLTYGLRSPADVTASEPQTLSGGSPGAPRVGCFFDLRFRLDSSAGRGEQRIELPIHGLYNVENCLAAATCALELGVTPRQIAGAVAEFRPASMRGEVLRLGATAGRAGGITVIDDSYNSNPDAAARALESARLLPARRRVAILGDMLELGPEEDAFHRQVGKRAAELGFEHVVAVGELSRHLHAAAEEHGARSTWFASATAVASWLATKPAIEGGAGGARQLGAGDLVVIKGSRGVGLERAVAALRELYGDGGGGDLEAKSTGGGGRD